MNVTVQLQDSARVALRTLDESDRRELQTWLDNLARWDHDERLRSMAKPSAEANVSVLDTGHDLALFFTLDERAKRITVVDLSKPSRWKNVPVAAG